MALLRSTRPNSDVAQRLHTTSLVHSLSMVLVPWSSAEFGFVFMIWAVMMVAMMLPSAALCDSYCDPRTSGEKRQRAFLVAGSRRWSYRRRLVADAAYVPCRACADSRRGAHAVPWVDRGLGLAPVFLASNVCFGSLADMLGCMKESPLYP
jgi:hypothetical protein